MNRRFTTNLHKNKALQEPPGVYRHCRLGHTLVDAVGEMVKAKKITAFLESHIMSVSISSPLWNSVAFFRVSERNSAICYGNLDGIRGLI